jgi:hypothetical protein
MRKNLIKECGWCDLFDGCWGVAGAIEWEKLFGPKIRDSLSDSDIESVECDKFEYEDSKVVVE